MPAGSSSSTGPLTVSIDSVARAESAASKRTGPARDSISQAGGEVQREERPGLDEGSLTRSFHAEWLMRDTHTPTPSLAPSVADLP
jgi:hypothetical protein